MAAGLPAVVYSVRRRQDPALRRSLRVPSVIEAAAAPDLTAKAQRRKGTAKEVELALSRADCTVIVACLDAIYFAIPLRLRAFAVIERRSDGRQAAAARTENISSISRLTCTAVSEPSTTTSLQRTGWPAATGFTTFTLMRETQRQAADAQ